MKWFDRWFARKCRWAWENRDVVDDVAKTPSTMRAVPQDIVEVSDSWQDGLRINVKKMIGGTVVSFRYYDRKLDRSDDRNYIITDDEDFGQELAKIITMESMRQT
jgi:hypothetical protein